jgi:HK97 gp10 family phage protein
MATRTIRVEGLPELEKKLRALPLGVTAAAGRAVKGETEETGGDVRRGAPVKTGHLRDSVQAEYDEATLSGTVAVTADYAKYVEHGTDDTSAQPFIQPAAQVTRRRFPRRVKREVKATLDRL